MKITNEREKRKSEVPRKYLGQAPPAAYHNATNSIVFLMINKVDECLKKKRKKNEKRSFSFSLSRARARAHTETSSMCLSCRRGWLAMLVHSRRRGNLYAILYVRTNIVSLALSLFRAHVKSDSHVDVERERRSPIKISYT